MVAAVRGNKGGGTAAGPGGPGGKGGAGGAGGAGGDIYKQSAGATNAAFGAQNRLLGELAKGPWGGGAPGTYNAKGYNAATQADPGLIRAGIGGYMNPYTQQVINRTGADINRQTQAGINELGSTAVGQGAFGGSRHGIAEGVAAGEGARALGDISAKMREQGYNTAAELAGRDITNRMTVGQQNQAARNEARQFGAGARNVAGQYNAGARTSGRNEWLDRISSAVSGGAALGQGGVNLGQQIQGATGADANRARGVSEALIGQSAGMFDSYTGQPFAGVERVLGALSGNPLTGTGTTTATQTPGLMSILGTAAGGASRMATKGAGGKGG